MDFVSKHEFGRFASPLNNFRLRGKHRVGFANASALAALMLSSTSHAAGLMNCLYHSHGGAIAAIEYSYSDKGGNSNVTKGTGFVISKDGHIITNNHVISVQKFDQKMEVATDKVTVRLGEISGSPLQALVLRRDKESDIALLKIDKRREPWPVVPLGDSTRIDPGDSLTGLGFAGGDLALVPTNPLTAANTYMHGVKKPWWQTALPLNPGNSGGPIFDNAGTVVGVAVALNEDAQGISYVVPLQYLSGFVADGGAKPVESGPCAIGGDEVRRGLRSELSKQKGEKLSTEQSKAANDTVDRAIASVSPTGPSRPENRLKILWVDDQPGNNSALAYSLQALGVVIVAIEDSDRITEAFEASKGFDLVITDMFRDSVRKRPNRPEAGWETVDIIRTKQLGVPVVIYAGSFAQQYNENHKDDELPPPVKLVTNDPVELFKFITELVKQKQSRPAQQTWAYYGRISKTTATGNHHCSENCRPRPTYTQYDVPINIRDIPTDKIGRLRNPTVVCQQGACDWSEVVKAPVVSPDGQTAQAVVGVWGSPTVWSISADLEMTDK